MDSYDVIIIGGGISGLTAAYELTKKAPNLKFIVLEAQNRVGGRTFSVPLKASIGTDRWDVASGIQEILGGQWVGLTQHHIMDLIQELGLKTYSQYISGDNLFQKDGGKVQKYQGDNFPGVSICGAIDAWNLFRKLQNDSKEVSPENPFKGSKAQQWNNTTLAEYLKREAWTKDGQEAVGLVCDAVYDSSPDQLSLLYFLMYLHSAGGDFQILTEEKGQGAEAFKIVGGAQSVSEALVKHLPDRSVKLDSPVSKVEQHEKGVTVTTSGGSSERFTAQRVVVAIPPCHVAKIEFTEPLPAPKLALMQSFRPKGNGGKFIVTYPEAFWRKAGLSGIAIFTGAKDPSTGEDLPDMSTYDSVSHNQAPALIGFTGLDPETPQKERKEGILKVLARFFGDEAMKPLDYYDQFWSQEPYELGCVASIPAGGMNEEYSQLMREPFGKIHWAGTETGTIWMGYMNGAVQAGQRAAEEVIEATGVEVDISQIGIKDK